MPLKKGGDACIVIKIPVLTAILLWGMISDLKTGKVKNKIIITGFVAGPALELIFPSAGGLADKLMGTAVPILALFILHVFSMMGAGDIKLISVTGAFLGLKAVINIMLGTLFLGGAVSIFLMLKRRILAERFNYFRDYARQSLRRRRVIPYDDLTSEDKRHLFHLSPCIFIAAAMYCLKLLFFKELF